MRYKSQQLEKFACEVMQKAGLSESEAKVFAESLIFADLRGIGSHGISRLITYSKRVETGAVTPCTKPTITSDKGAFFHANGNNGIGAYVARQITDICIERARQYGCCFASVGNATHFGTGAFFTKYAAKQGMVAFACSNSEAGVVPIGGAKTMLGTNPLSVAIPAGSHEPLILDMATSVVARGKVVLAQKEGQSIPNNWCVDASGIATTDPTEGLKGGMLPFGGPKGYAIGLIIDILCSVLAGANNGRTIGHFWDDFETHQNLGYFIGCFDASSFMPLAAFEKGVDDIWQEFKECPTATGVSEIIIPGEPEDRRYSFNLENGIELSNVVVNELISLGEVYGVPCDFIN